MCKMAIPPHHATNETRREPFPNRGLIFQYETEAGAKQIEKRYLFFFLGFFDGFKAASVSRQKQKRKNISQRAKDAFVFVVSRIRTKMISIIQNGNKNNWLRKTFFLSKRVRKDSIASGLFLLIRKQTAASRPARKAPKAQTSFPFIFISNSVS